VCMPLVTVCCMHVYVQLICVARVRIPLAEVCCGCACAFSLARLSLLLLVLHYVVEMIFHVSRLLYFSEKSEIANYGYATILAILIITKYSTLTRPKVSFRPPNIDVKFSCL